RDVGGHASKARPVPHGRREARDLRRARTVRGREERLGPLQHAHAAPVLLGRPGPARDPGPALVVRLLLQVHLPPIRFRLEGVPLLPVRPRFDLVGKVALRGEPAHQPAERPSLLLLLQAAGLRLVSMPGPPVLPPLPERPLLPPPPRQAPRGPPGVGRRARRPVGRLALGRFTARRRGRGHREGDLTRAPVQAATGLAAPLAVGGLRLRWSLTGALGSGPSGT